MQRSTDELLNALAPMFTRIEPRLRPPSTSVPSCPTCPNAMAGRSPSTPGTATQWLLNGARWDTSGAMSVVRRFAVARLDAAAAPASLTVGALDESGQERKGSATSGVKRQHMGCAGGVDNGVNTVYLAYVRADSWHALIGARQWIPAEQVTSPVTAVTTGLPLNLVFATKGELGVSLLSDAYADGVRFDFLTGDEVYGACTKLRTFLEEHEQAYVLRVRSSFTVTLGGGTTLTFTPVEPFACWATASASVRAAIALCPPHPAVRMITSALGAILGKGTR
ncbi:transposase [Nonomuraea antimicrobica]